MARHTEKNADKIARLDALLLEMDVVSGQGPGTGGGYNAVVNVAALLKFQDEIEKTMGESIDIGDYFAVLADRVMKGGAIVLTDEATTGHVVEVEFSKKVRF